MGLTSDALKRIDSQAAAPVILPLSSVEAWPAGGEHADFARPALDASRSAARFSFPALPTERPASIFASPQVIWPSDVDADRSLQAAEMANGLLRRWPLDRTTILAITSPGPGDGKTRLLTALAPQLARRVAGSVVVVDANFRHPGLTSLAIVSSDVAGSSGVIYPTNRRNLSFLPAPGSRRDFGASLDRFWFEELREAGSLVLVELPSLAYAETVGLSRHCDGVYLAVRLGHTSRRALSRSAKILRRAGSRLSGCLVVG